MAYAISPSVNVTEKDLTNVVPAVATTIGGYVGAFTWGPVLEVRSIADEKQLVNTFGTPNNSNFTSFFSAANFLAYGNNLQTVRVVGATAKNAVSSGTAVLIKNETDYDTNYAGGEGAVGTWAAKYAGSLGNSIKVAIADSVTFENLVGAGTITALTTSATIAGVDTTFLAQVRVGDILKTTTGVRIGIVAAIASDTSLTLTANAATAVSAAGYRIDWGYGYLFSEAPSTSEYAAARSGASDELHIVIIDEDGLFTGVKGDILETYAFVSKGSDAKNNDGTTNYYAEVINRNSQYIWWMDHPAEVTDWGTSVANNTFESLDASLTDSLTGGVDANSPTDGEKIAGYALFSNDEEIDVSLLITGDASATVSSYVIQSIAEVRKDCIVFVSPELADVQGNVGSEATDIVAFRNTLPSSSYAVMDSGWKYQYDRYNDTYRWIPLNADIAGICARSDNLTDPWYSPAGLNRGGVKNIVKLAYSPSKTDRDTLYNKGVNPVVTFPGQGTVLYGDKTLLSKPSAFDRINVRRLFIVLEKSIATAAKYQLFEFNDVFSRAQFRNLVEPFLREVQGRRGLTEFAVVCDETNNTPEVIATNNFVGDIYIRPNYSINFIQLNFIAKKDSVSFNTTV
jgi:hypothetical protein